MSHVHADIVSLTAFQQAFHSFIVRQTDLLDATVQEIKRTEKMLEDAEWAWEHELWDRRRRLDDCEDEAAYLASIGRYVDCSSLYEDVDEAEECLARVHALQEQVADAISHYMEVHQRYTYMLERDRVRTMQFLSDMITALEAYQAVRISGGSAAANATTSSVIRAVRRSRRTLARITGTDGERTGVQIAVGKFGLVPLPVTQPIPGFESIFRVPGTSAVVAHIASLNTRIDAPTGGSDANSKLLRDDLVARLVKSLDLEQPATVLVMVDAATDAEYVYALSGDGTWLLVPADSEIDDSDLSEPPHLSLSLKEQTVETEDREDVNA